MVVTVETNTGIATSWAGGEHGAAPRSPPSGQVAVDVLQLHDGVSRRAAPRPSARPPRVKTFSVWPGEVEEDEGGRRSESGMATAMMPVGRRAAKEEEDDQDGEPAATRGLVLEREMAARM